MSTLIKVTIASGFHLFPFRTEKLSPVTPMVLRNSGRVGSRRFQAESFTTTVVRLSFFCFFLSFSRYYQNKVLYLPNKTLFAYEYYFGFGSTECVEALLFIDTNSPSIGTHGENYRVLAQLWQGPRFGIVC